MLVTAGFAVYCRNIFLFFRRKESFDFRCSAQKSQLNYVQPEVIWLSIFPPPHGPRRRGDILRSAAFLRL